MNIGDIWRITFSESWNEANCGAKIYIASPKSSTVKICGNDFDKRVRTRLSINFAAKAPCLLRSYLHNKQFRLVFPFFLLCLLEVQAATCHMSFCLLCSLHVLLARFLPEKSLIYETCTQPLKHRIIEITAIYPKLF